MIHTRTLGALLLSTMLSGCLIVHEREVVARLSFLAVM